MLSCVWFFAAPWTAAHHGIFQARILEWVTISFSREIFPIQGWIPSLASPALAGRFFYHCATLEAQLLQWQSLQYINDLIIHYKMLYILNLHNVTCQMYFNKKWKVEFCNCKKKKALDKNNLPRTDKFSEFPWQPYVLNHFSHVWLCVTLWTAASQAPLSMGFCRQEYWSGLPRPPPGGLSHQESNPGLLHRRRGVCHSFHLGSPEYPWINYALLDISTKNMVLGQNQKWYYGISWWNSHP